MRVGRRKVTDDSCRWMYSHPCSVEGCLRVSSNQVGHVLRANVNAEFSDDLIYINLSQGISIDDSKRAY